MEFCMNPIASFRDRLYQINTEVLLTTFPELSEKMARTTQSLKAEYGDISRGAGRDTKYVCSGQLVSGAGHCGWNAICSWFDKAFSPERSRRITTSGLT